jgi:hypothetical protein
MHGERAPMIEVNLREAAFHGTINENNYSLRLQAKNIPLWK